MADLRVHALGCPWGTGFPGHARRRVGTIGWLVAVAAGSAPGEALRTVGSWLCVLWACCHLAEAPAPSPPSPSPSTPRRQPTTMAPFGSTGGRISVLGSSPPSA